MNNRISSNKIGLLPGIMAENQADEIILDPNQIARHYLRSWFVLDLISSLPLDYTITLLLPDAGSFTHLLHAGLSNTYTRDVRNSNFISVRFLFGFKNRIRFGMSLVPFEKKLCLVLISVVIYYFDYVILE